jgi:hypothetical protein
MKTFLPSIFPLMDSFHVACNLFDRRGSHRYNSLKTNSMKKLVALFALSLLTVSTSIAGENPKLWKEINRKLKVDVSQIDFSKSKRNSVVVKFHVVNNEIEILDAEGSDELRALIVQKLEEMDIKSTAGVNEVYQYRFNFRSED